MPCQYNKKKEKKNLEKLPRKNCLKILKTNNNNNNNKIIKKIIIIVHLYSAHIHYLLEALTIYIAKTTDLHQGTYKLKRKQQS